ncbi:DnaJ domain protein [uncultured delta proteobacterium]|uniref:DnaJ domain protein n=1 Tax=uncultured delta proteobacterium TaxID=34034 RepID=A0A212JM65_9DELT|nr:DnaJ domain protein [uncultured delta proteobacterium]
MTRKQALARLGLSDGATAEERKRAYRKLAFELHPDLHPDNPNAGKEFQLLNEAYVFLTSGPQEAPGGGRSRAQSRAQAQAEATEKARAEAHKAYERAKKRVHEEQQSGSARQEATEAGNGKSAGAEKTRDMKREEVLRDLLRDPFARRVFEDIYTQIREEAARKQQRGGTAGGRKTSAPQEPGLFERTADNVSDWFRRQIDEEQTVRVAGPLVPGKRLRLQIHQGVFGKSHTIELTLPPEFEPGRPIRLRGMGKRIGKWQGDLYLRITN